MVRWSLCTERKELLCVNSIFRENILKEWRGKTDIFRWMKTNSICWEKTSLWRMVTYWYVGWKWKNEKNYPVETLIKTRKEGWYKYQIKYTLSKKKKNKTKQSFPPTELNNLHINCYLNVTFSIFRNYRTVTKARSWA